MSAFLLLVYFGVLAAIGSDVTAFSLPTVSAVLGWVAFGAVTVGGGCFLWEMVR